MSSFKRWQFTHLKIVQLRFRGLSHAFVLETVSKQRRYQGAPQPERLNRNGQPSTEHESHFCDAKLRPLTSISASLGPWLVWRSARSTKLYSSPTEPGCCHAESWGYAQSLNFVEVWSQTGTWVRQTSRQQSRICRHVVFLALLTLSTLHPLLLCGGHLVYYCT